MTLRTRAVMLAGAVLLLVAATAWWTIGAAAPLPPQPSSTEPAAAATSSESAAARPDVAEPERVAQTVDDDGGGNEFQARYSLRIACVFANDGRAAAGAEVRYSEQSIPRERRDDVERFLRAHGRSTTTDPDGRATVTVRYGSQVCVRFGEYFGLLRCDDLRVQSRFEQRIELQRDLTATVIVHDADGRPVADLSLVATWAKQQDWAPKRVRLAPTDADGVTVFPHAQLSFWPAAPRFAEQAIAIAPDGFALPEHECLVTYAMLLAGDPIHLTVPVGGTLRVQVQDGFGQPVVTRLFLDERSDETDFAGHAVFPLVPLGQTWSLRWGASAKESIPVPEPYAVVEGPQRRGQVVTHRVVVPAAHLRLRGTLRRSDGQALAHPVLSTRLDRAPKPGTVPFAAQIGFQFEAIGGFVCNVECPDAAESVDALLVVEDHSLAEAWTHRIPAAKLAKPDAAGFVDLGTLEIPVDVASPPLLQVTVRTENGASVRDGDVTIADANGARLRLQRSRVGDTFTFRGRSDAVEFVVTVQGKGQLPAPRTRCRRGDAITVTLRPSASLLVPVVWSERVRVQAEVTLTSLATGASEKRSDTGDGSVAFDGLEPGAYRLSFLWQERVFHELPPIELRAGDNVVPADGVPLDLRHAFPLVSVSFEPAVAQRNEKLALVPTGATDAATTTPIRVATTFDVRPEPHDLLVVSPGYVAQRLGNVRADLRVELQPLSPLQLSVQDPRGQPVVRLAIVRDGIADPVLRAFDDGNEHGPLELGIADPVTVRYAPGTELDCTIVRGGTAGPPQRVVVGSGPQSATLQ